MQSELKQIKLDKIVFSKTNPRKEFNKNSLQELADSIQSNGLINPVTVRKKGSNFELVSGERRFRAVKLLKDKSILAMVRSLTDDQVLEIQYIENLQRQDVHPLDEASFISGMLDTGKYSLETIADKIGKTKSYVASRYQLVRLVDEIRKVYAEGKIELGHVLLICKYPEEQQQKIWKYIQQQFRTPTVSDLKSFIAGTYMPNLNLAPFNRKDKLLLSEAGSCNDCSKRTGNAEDLFSEFSGKNLCTDQSCYKEKINYHIAFSLDRAEANGKPLLKLSDKYETKKETLGFKDFEKTNKAEGKNVVKGIYISGPEKGKTVNIILKNETEEVKGQKSNENREPTAKEKLARLNEEIKQKREAAFKNALGTAILEQRLDEGILIPLAKRIYINIEDIFFYESMILNLDDIKKMTFPTFIILFNKCAVKAAMNGYDFYDDKFLPEVAQYFSLDEKAIRKIIEDELPLLKKLPDKAEDVKSETEEDKN